MTLSRICAAGVAAVFLLCLAMPVSAVILEVTCKGTVSTVDIAKNTLTIKNPLQYGCEYPASGDPVCTWTPMTQSSLTGTVPDPAAFTVFSGAENIVATSLGGAGEEWITLAKIYGDKETEQYVTDIVGDPGTVPLPLIADYSVETTTVPDCTACTGTTCTAKEAAVTVKISGVSVMEKTLSPGESFTYNGRNDGSSVTVKFVSGEAAAQSCAGNAGMTGPQAVSDFVIDITPPVGYSQVDLRTATTTRPDEALTPLPETTALPLTTPAATTAATTTTKAGAFFPSAALGALGIAALLLFRR